MSGIEAVLAAHELAYGCPEYWRCGCGFVSDRTDGRASINEHRAAEIAAWLLSDEQVERAEAEIDGYVAEGWMARQAATAALTAVLGGGGDE